MYTLRPINWCVEWFIIGITSCSFLNQHFHWLFSTRPLHVSARNSITPTIIVEMEGLEKFLREIGDDLVCYKEEFVKLAVKRILRLHEVERMNIPTIYKRMQTPGTRKKLKQKCLDKFLQPKTPRHLKFFMPLSLTLPPPLSPKTFTSCRRSSSTGHFFETRSWPSKLQDRALPHPLPFPFFF